MSLIFWSLSFFYFFLAVFLAFYIPGTIVLKKLKLQFFANFVLSIVLGMVLFAWQGMIFGYLGIRWASYIYLISGLILWTYLLFKEKSWNKLKVSNLGKLNIGLVFLIILGTILQLSTTFFQGVIFKNGMYFCCAVPDSLYHIALTNQIVKAFPPIEPGMSGVIVHNYHYWSNLVAAELIRVFKLPLIATQYQYFTFLISIFIGLSAVMFTQIFGMARKYAYWLVFFLYFSGDITYLLLFILGKGLSFDLPFLENAAWLWISPPRVFATVIFFAGLSSLYLWIKRRDFLTGIIVAFIFSALVGFKIYDGVFAFCGLAALGLFFLHKKDFRMIIPLILTVILGLIVYLPVNNASGGLIFVGFWRFENFIAQPALGLSHLELARMIYLAHHNWLRILFQESGYVFLYIVFVFGTVILGIFQTKKSLSLLPIEINIFLISGSLVSAFLGFLFIQVSGGANSSQFLITVDIIGSIYAALFCFYWIERLRGKIKVLAILLIIFLTIPRVMHQVYLSISSQVYEQGLTVDKNQLKALNYLKNKTLPSSIILMDNIDNPQNTSLKSLKNSWIGSNSYYVNFLADRQLFIDGDNSIVESHGINIQQRLKTARIILYSKDASLIEKTLIENNIQYIYLPDGVSTESGILKIKTIVLVFSSGTVKILKVN